MAVIRGVSSSQLRVACCLELLRCINTPWSSDVASFVQQCLPLTSSNTAELHSLNNLLQMQMVLQERYGIADFNFSDTSTGEVSGAPLTSQSSVLL